MPVDVVTGANTDRARDFILDGPLPIPFWRYYDSRWHADDRGLGFGHRHTFEHWLIFDLDGVTYRAADGHDCHFRHLLYDGERKMSGGYVLERVSSERYVLRHRAKRTLVFRRPTAIAFEAELAEIVDERAPHPERALLQYEGGRLAKILAPRDHTLRLEWDADGHLHGVQHRTPEGERTWLIRYEYERGFLVAGRDAYEQTFRLGYDANGRLARRMDRRGYSFLFEHDREGRCTSSAGEDGVMAVQLTYKPLEYETRVLDANGAEWVYQYNQAKVLLFVTDPYGGIRYFKTGEDGRLLAEFDAKSAPTRYVHDEAGAPIARITPKGEPIALPEGVSARPRHRVPRLPIEWDLGDLWQRGFGLPDPYETLVGVPGEIRALLTTSESPSRGRVETHRDVQGLRVREEIESGPSRSFGYNENGGVRRVTDMEGGTWRIEHASWNHIVREVDPLGSEVHYEYSATEKLTAVVDAAGTRTDYGYDLKDRLVEVRRAGPIRERYAYDEVGNLMEKRDGAGNVLMTLAYDHRGLLLKRTLASGDEHTFHYDERGQMIEAVALRHRCAFAHDALKRRILDKRDGRGVEHRYRGDALASTTVLDRFRTEYHHLPDGSVVIVDPTGHTHRVRSHGRGVFTRDFANGWSETVQYHPRGGRPLVKAFYRAEAPGERWERRYSYSAEGQLREAFDSERGRTQFAHDAALRLVATTHPDGRVDSYQYNRPGTLFQSPT
ncbi:MAG: RHS repeat protein, partial [Sandaracinaceae bacterium]|nr:RHS repeat protein [Sandaracinaceae bacterium]